jgi:hypothetical protein
VDLLRRRAPESRGVLHGGVIDVVETPHGVCFLPVRALPALLPDALAPGGAASPTPLRPGATGPRTPLRLQIRGLAGARSRGRCPENSPGGRRKKA